MMWGTALFPSPIQRFSRARATQPARVRVAAAVDDVAVGGFVGIRVVVVDCRHLALVDRRV
jgi:hypothetical protein